MENFTEEEKRILSNFVSSVDNDVFVLRNLPETVKGALFSRYSRSSKSLKRVLLDDFISSGNIVAVGENPEVGSKKAEEFYERVLVGYGDDSIAELAGVHIAMENVSNVATKIIEDARIGISPLEKSTRYVYFDKKKDGKWLYLEEPSVMESGFADLYRQTCDLLFERYSSLVPKISGFFSEKMPQEEGVSDRAYKTSLRAKTCDVLRGILPASALTNMGLFGNGRAFEYLITRMHASRLGEIKRLAASMEEELKKSIPVFVKRASTKHGKAMGEYLNGVSDTVSKLAPKLDTSGAVGVKLVDYDKDGENKAIAAAVFPFSSASFSQLLEYVRSLGAGKKKELFSAYIGDRKNRRHKPGRGFELPYYTFEVICNFGAYRDIHRHRILTQQRQLISTVLGYTLPPEIEDAGYASEYGEVMDAADDAWKQISAKMPLEAQYVVPLIYNIRFHLTMNAREAYHFCELRSARQGHIDYRRVAWGVYDEIKKVHPLIADGMIFIDREEYSLERLEAEKKLDKKIESVRRKYGDIR